jgi:hypothetical protein
MIAKVDMTKNRMLLLNIETDVSQMHVWRMRLGFSILGHVDFDSLKMMA